MGYMFITCGLLAYLVQQIYQGMIALDYPQENVSGLILSGLVIPVFFVSIFYYRIKRNQIEKEQQSKIKGSNDWPEKRYLHLSYKVHARRYGNG